MRGHKCLRLYYRARTIALSNDHPFHVVAILVRGRAVIAIAANSATEHPKATRRYPNGQIARTLHAEMAVCLRARPGDKIIVLRFLADGTLTMAKPCRHCMKHIRRAGIKRVTYSDWDGQIQRFSP